MRKALVPLVALIATVPGLAAVGPAVSAAGPSGPSGSSGSAQARPAHHRIVDPTRDVYQLLENPDGSDAGFVRRPRVRNGDITSVVIRHRPAAVKVTVRLAKLRRPAQFTYTLVSLRTAKDTWNTTLYAYASHPAPEIHFDDSSGSGAACPARERTDRLRRRRHPGPCSPALPGQPGLGPCLGRRDQSSAEPRTPSGPRRGAGRQAQRAAAVQRQGLARRPLSHRPGRWGPGPFSRSRSAARSCAVTHATGPARPPRAARRRR